MYIKEKLRYLYVRSKQVELLVKMSQAISRVPYLGKLFSVLIDNVILYLFGAELISSSLKIKKLIIGHTTGVVLGGNGIKCNGTLHVSSGVVFGRRYHSDYDTSKAMFTINGDLTVGANTVLLGPLTINGPVIIGAMSLVTKDILESGIYVGIPAKKIREI